MNLFEFLKRHRWTILALLGFILSRVFVLKFPPPFYSDVSHDYERYANMWGFGVTPYLKHFYEYPPATIPFLYLPKLIADSGWGRYYMNYRYGIFMFDLILFLFILGSFKKTSSKVLSKIVAVLFYLGAPMIAKDFFYEGIDLAFAGSLTIGLISLLLYSQRKLINRVVFWAFFWLSTSIKFMSAPLLVPFFYLKQLRLKKEILAAFLGFLIIWGLPLVIFRSSLSVMFVFHGKRPLKYASFPSYIVEAINQYTQTEVRINLAPDFQMAGPVSDQVTSIFKVVFPVSVLLVLIYGFMVVSKSSLKNIPDLWQKALFLKRYSLSHLDPFVFGIKISLILFYTLFLTGKIFSQPFHIWPIPLIAAFPFKSIKRQLIFVFLATWLLIIDTTPWISFDESVILIPPMTTKIYIFFLRFLPIIILLFLSFKLPNKMKIKNK